MIIKNLRRKKGYRNNLLYLYGIEEEWYGEKQWKGSMAYAKTV